MLDIFVLEEDYFQQARLEDAIHKSKQIYILRIGKVDLYDKPNQLLERITERGSHLLFFLDIESDSDIICTDVIDAVSGNGFHIQVLEG